MHAHTHTCTHTHFRLQAAERETSLPRAAEGNEVPAIFLGRLLRLAQQMFPGKGVEETVPDVGAEDLG